MSSLPPNPYQPSGDQGGSNPYLPPDSGVDSSNPYAPPSASDSSNPYAYQPSATPEASNPYLPTAPSVPTTGSQAPSGPSYAIPNATGASPYGAAGLPGAVGTQNTAKSNKSAFIVVAAIVSLLIGVAGAVAMMMSGNSKPEPDPGISSVSPTAPSTTDEDQPTDLDPAPTAPQSPVYTGQGTASPGTRDNPNPIGATLLTDEWNVTVTGVDMDATAYLGAEDQYNLDILEPGQKFILVSLEATYVGDETGFSYDVMVDFVSTNGEVYGESYAYFPDRWGKISEVYPGGSMTGRLAIAIPEDATGVLRVTPGYYDVDPFFVATE